MRSGFTLLELMISVMLISLMVFMISRGESSLRIASEAMQRAGDAQEIRQGVLSLLIDDLLQAQKVRILSGREYDQLFLDNTRHSLYGRPKSQVAYLITKPDRHLIRLESSRVLTLPLQMTALERTHHFTVLREVDSFKAYLDQNPQKEGCQILIYIDPKADDPLLFELGLLNNDSC